jgi:hypothetical protein
VELAALTTSSDTLDPSDKIPKTESQEGKLRRGRRIYAIVGSPQAGYTPQRKSNTLRTGPLKLHETEDEGSLEQTICTDGDQSLSDAMEGTEAEWWEILTDYMEDTDIEQPQGSRELPNHIQPHDGQVQTNSLFSTGDATERLHAVTTEGQPTASRA